MSKAFHAAIAASPMILAKSQVGLKALSKNSKYVAPAETSKCGGSLDIDAAMAPEQPNAPRWDYALVYDERVVYLEVHPAASGANIREVLAKLKWLRHWLTTHAPALNALPKYKTPFVWVASGKTDLLPSGAQRAALAEAGLKPVSHLHLS